MTGYLQVVIDQMQPYAAAAETINELLWETGQSTIIDLGSGSGGPWPALKGSLNSEGDPVNVVLSDLYPNQDFAGQLEEIEGISFHADPVSALAVPKELDGLRTMFTSLHHFASAEVEEILQNAQSAGVPFAAFEATHRSVRGFLVTLLIPILVLFMMPKVRPRRLAALLFTYLPPILPLLIWWDGLASTARTYSPSELEEIVQRIASSGYEWRVSEIAVPGAPIPITQITGRPVNVE